jgi:hypothetical protein
LALAGRRLLDLADPRQGGAPQPVGITRDAAFAVLLEAGHAAVESGNALAEVGHEVLV